VVHQLGVAGYIETIRGRNGGMRLKMAPADINLGALVRATEPDFYMAECFGPGGSTCAIGADCRLKQALTQATAAYLAMLDTQTLAMLLPMPPAAEAPLVFHPAALAA
jgi:Rrf2 family nitric oxide-sensitive transcriptional repressor